MSSYSLVHYFIPEDNEDEKILNTFGVPLNMKKIKLKDLSDNFPLKGEYIFRFKTKYRKEPVFVDVIEKEENVPIFEGKVIMKVNRRNWHCKNQDTEQNDITENKHNLEIRDMHKFF